MSSFSTFIKESYNELVNKVSWPTWSELQESSVIVLISSIIIALVVFAMDSAFSKIMELIYQLVYSL
jgi:preprotein translocase subunit SecE